MTSAKVIKDSVSPAGHRLTTIEVTMHRFVLAEFNTHRVFSRNSASSRAIPFNKQVDRVTRDPAIPVSWPAEQSGMQGGDELDEDARCAAEGTWLDAKVEAVKAARRLNRLGVHKSVTNRLLEPFMRHTVIVSATDWDGFWTQRCSPLAQPEIRVAAEAMREVYDASTPQPLGEGDWHLPYIEEQDWEAMADRTRIGKDMYPLAKKVSAARCARVSYLTHDGRQDMDADLALYDRLVTAQPPHASPLEHVATPADPFNWFGNDVPAGNFTGWHQLRHRVLGST